ncbi:MAG: EFR1 family ferrodoxin [Clostridia bacterium]|nr:EFR1 family ferrodoxin [Clostridia bacterium]
MRDIVIIYFSGTGNTKYVSEEICNSFIKQGYTVSLISAEDKEMLEKQNYNGSLVGIGFPCYALNYPDIIANAIRELPFYTNAVPAFIFSTKGWSTGNSMKNLAVLMRMHNLLTIKTGSFICPNNGWITLFSPNFILCRNMKFDNKLLEKIANYAEDVINLLAVYDKKQFCISTVSNPIMTLLSWLLVKMEGQVMKYYRVESDKCTGCGLCVRKCPDHNIKFDENQRVVFVNPNKCTWCVRCISDCPKDAIRLGRPLTGKGWYTKSLRNEFLKKINKEVNRE